MEVGVVCIPDDEDLNRFRRLVDTTDGWTVRYNKNNIKVWVQNISEKEAASTRIRMLKTVNVMNDVSAPLAYDVLHDPEYRKEWDKHMIEGKEICMLNPNNDISYYSLKCPTPMKNRDFVTQRTWLETDREYLIFNHSVFHKDLPPKKGLIRGESILTGYLVRPKGKNSCELFYVTQSDPKGSVPKWAVNKVAQIVAPSVMKTLHKACLRYPKWKSTHNPGFKPWLYPEQAMGYLPRLNMEDLLAKQEYQSDDSLDETGMKEEDFNDSNLLAEDKVL
ncbi:START domain-containing protein 10 isoform X2 [Strongylocentrotus purpuratus]|uniref:START domain-containing protein 10 n=2 Tax=Strongylocentrotus purpuratus TaxID=7668 RepID=A0A7M7NHZ2_STRPU|nr:START domain-containing protein 10 isoform X1 [Strongylocentrotus purpuratus]XP_030836616.1 START domain-containing protein 10 isoform X2 [Strongylocentrotus purpuratus]